MKSTHKIRSNNMKDYDNESVISKFKNLFGDFNNRQVIYSGYDRNKIFFHIIKTDNKDYKFIMVTKIIDGYSIMYTYLENDIEYEINHETINEFTAETFENVFDI